MGAAGTAYGLLYICVYINPGFADRRTELRLLAFGNGGTAARRIEDVIRLFVYAFVWGVLMTLHFKMGRGIVSLITYIGYALLALAWTWRVEPRLKDAGLPRWYLLPLVCAPIILLGFLVQYQVIGGTVALVLFVLTQIPIMFIRRKASDAGPPGAEPMTGQ
jgi:uncharacterized membrane protein YhaH (DUF805 family)